MLPPRVARLIPAKRGLEFAALFTAVASLLAGVLIARMLGPSGRGEVVIIATWGQALAWVGGLSIDKALIARSNTDGRRQTNLPLTAGLSLMLAVGVAVAAVSVIASTDLLDSLAQRIALSAVVLGTVACDIRAASLLFHDRWKEYAQLRFAQPALYLVGCVVSALAITRYPDRGVLLIAISLCVSLWVPALFLGGLPVLRVARPVRALDVQKMFAFAGAYHVGSVLSFLSSRIDLMAVSLLFGTAEVGLYSVAATLGGIAAIFGSANLMRGVTGKLGLARIDRGGLIAAGLITVTVAVSATWVLRLAYGPDFAAAGELTRYLCVGGLLFYLRQGFNGQLTGLGRPWATAWANGVGIAGFVGMLPFAETPTQVAAISAFCTGLSAALSFVLLRHYGKRRDREQTPGSIEPSTAQEPVTVSPAQTAT